MFRALTDDRKPLWLYPNLLSLGAPLVAMAWLYVFAKVWRVDYLPWTAYLALALAVWTIHVVERLHIAKVRGRGGGPPPGERHHFHVRHAVGFLVMVALAVVVLLVLVLVHLPISVFGYLTIGVVLVIGFFALSRAGHGRTREIEYGKNILAGAAMAYGTAMLAHVFLPAIGKHDLVTSREFLTFAILCVLHLCAMDFWEKSAMGDSTDATADAPGDLALTLPVLVLAIVALGFAITSHQQSVRPFYYAILTGTALIHVINRNRRKFTAEQLRVLADVAMLAPALVFHAYLAL